MESSAGSVDQVLRDPISLELQLPPELWQDIFQLTIFAYGQPIPPCPREPWIISSVSRHWRSVALSTPSLWSHIILNFSTIIDPGGKMHKIDPMLEYTRLLLQRSAETPITLRIQLVRFSLEYGAPQAFFDLLLPTSNRWELLHIRGASRETMNAFESIRGHLSTLRVLSLSFSSQGGQDFHSDLFLQAPRLEAVAYFGTDNVHFTLPLRQILVYKTTMIANVVQALVDGGNLTELYISSFSGSASSTETIPYRAPPSLVRLEIAFFNGDESIWDSRAYKGFFDILTFPSLRTLSLNSPPQGYHRALIHMASQFTSPWPLEHLSVRLSDTEMKPRELHSLLSLSPRLTSLEINYPTSADLELLIATPSNAILPHLEEVKFFVDVPQLRLDVLTNVQDHSMIRLLRSRKVETPKGSVALKSFTLAFPTSEESFEALGILHQLFSPDNFPSTSTQDDASLQKYFMWRNTLQSAFHQWNIRSPGHGAAFEKLDRDVFSEMEREGFEAPVLLVGGPLSSHFRPFVNMIQKLTGLHLEWHQLSLLTRLPHGYQRFSFAPRGRDLMRKWAPLLYQHVQHIHWQPSGFRCLTYVPDNSALRSRENYMEMLYGPTWNDDSPQQNFARRQSQLKRDCSDWDKL